MTLGQWIKAGNCNLSNYSEHFICEELQTRPKDLRNWELSDIYATKYGKLAKREHDNWFEAGRYIEPEEDKCNMMRFFS